MHPSMFVIFINTFYTSCRGIVQFFRQQAMAQNATTNTNSTISVQQAGGYWILIPYAVFVFVKKAPSD
jgi:hypothetical protein